jgi:hypothetical protein
MKNLLVFMAMIVLLGCDESLKPTKVYKDGTVKAADGKHYPAPPAVLERMRELGLLSPTPTPTPSHGKLYEGYFSEYLHSLGRMKQLTPTP